MAQSALEGIPAGESPYREPKSRCFRFRLVAAVQARKTNDCCYRKQSLQQDFREDQLYPLKLPVEADHRQVTALACADLVLSTQSGDLN